MTVERKVAKLESKVVEIEFAHKSTEGKLHDIAENSKENSTKIDLVHTLSASMDKTLAVMCERLENALANQDRLEKVIELSQIGLDTRIGGNEDAHTDLSEQVAVLTSQQENCRAHAGKRSDRKWSMVTLVPYALVTALISSGVAYAFTSSKSSEVAIKQTQIDKIQKQLDNLLKTKKDNLTSP